MEYRGSNKTKNRVAIYSCGVQNLRVRVGICTKFKFRFLGVFLAKTNLAFCFFTKSQIVEKLVCKKIPHYSTAILPSSTYIHLYILLVRNSTVFHFLAQLLIPGCFMVSGHRKFNLLSPPAPVFLALRFFSIFSMRTYFGPKITKMGQKQ